MSTLFVLNGPEIGQSFHLKEGGNYVGRSGENDIPIKDETVSRRHLKIVKKGNQHFVTDLGSLNGTFYGGSYLAPGIELNIKEGVPIAIGMTVIGIGESSLKQMMPFLDSIGLTKETEKESGIFIVHKAKTNQKKLELLYKISDLLGQKQPVKETLGKILDVIVELLVRIDRAVFILIDPDTTKITHFVYRAKETSDTTVPNYSLEVVYRVIKKKGAVMISDSHTEEVHDELAATLKVKRISSVLCVPLISGSQVVGAVYVDSVKKPYRFVEEDVSLFQDVAQRAAAFIHHEQFSSELSKIIEDLTPDT